YTRAFFQPVGFSHHRRFRRCERSFKGFEHKCQASAEKKAKEFSPFFQKAGFPGLFKDILLSTSLLSPSATRSFSVVNHVMLRHICQFTASCDS
ncbi:hypothetical protein, partial [Brucella sp. 22210]|uniref:hypothetical protein n=1 Tax=Brucella sp. 22210 TaxID=3453892 RepID=UPI003F834A58